VDEAGRVAGDLSGALAHDGGKRGRGVAVGEHQRRGAHRLPPAVGIAAQQRMAALGLPAIRIRSAGRPPARQRSGRLERRPGELLDLDPAMLRCCSPSESRSSPQSMPTARCSRRRNAAGPSGAGNR
jgi:hypothetical protein